MRKLLILAIIACALGSCRNEQKPAAEELRQDDPTDPNPDTGEAYNLDSHLILERATYYC